MMSTIEYSEKFHSAEGLTVTRADLVRVVYETHGGMSHKEAQQIVDQIISSIKERLTKGENVKLAGFGSLNVVPRKGRLGRNPQTGERVQILPSRHVVFKISQLVGF